MKALEAGSKRCKPFFSLRILSIELVDWYNDSR